MKHLFLCFIIAASLGLDIILLNIVQNTSLTFQVYVPSLCLISSTILMVCIQTILWLFNYSDITQTGIVCLNFILNIAKSTYLSISYYYTTIPSSMVMISFVTFVLSIVLGLMLRNDDKTKVEPLKYIIINSTFNETEKTCSICLQDFIQNENINITPCNHFFHITCMKELIKNKITSCPNCRLSILQPEGLSNE